MGSDALQGQCPKRLKHFPHNSTSEGPAFSQSLYLGDKASTSDHGSPPPSPPGGSHWTGGLFRPRSRIMYCCFMVQRFEGQETCPLTPCKAPALLAHSLGGSGTVLMEARIPGLQAECMHGLRHQTHYPKHLLSTALLSVGFDLIAK